MLPVAISILASAAMVWTIPADLPGTPHDGAQMIVGLQGMALTATAAVRGAWFLIRERRTIARIICDLIEAK
jgi:hypothetical protein